MGKAVDSEKPHPSPSPKGEGSDGAPAPGLICLKGGDLALEIQESGTKPYVTAIKDIFKEDFFEEKYILYVPK
ncbi:hypothetical protein [Niabella ginsengisoli]|uniref:Uncharacterized protein n=1 Tax=Niabella ginsengisoli TaxID=522298 RepID=A0ABS9SG49_9BACT|nr:hypothetical protein [Niabella ginsengisoli]MCH5597333.1 hypothetical protein [Niabella ginsengisoli]